MPDPNLRPEHAQSFELSAERIGQHGRVRVSYFQEDLEDALISQSAPLVPGSSTLFNYVQNIDKARTRGLEIVGERRDVLIQGLDLTASVTWKACWALGQATTAGPPANCKPVPGATALAASTSPPHQVTVREIQSVNNG